MDQSHVFFSNSLFVCWGSPTPHFKLDPKAQSTTDIKGDTRQEERSESGLPKSGVFKSGGSGPRTAKGRADPMAFSWEIPAGEERGWQRSTWLRNGSA